MKLRVLEILKEKGKTKYWLNMQMGLSYQNFNNMVYNNTKGIKSSSILLDFEYIRQCLPKFFL